MFGAEDSAKTGKVEGPKRGEKISLSSKNIPPRLVMGPAFLHGCVEGEQQLQTWALCHSWDPNTYQAT